MDLVNTSFENISELKCLGSTVINQNCIHEEVKSRLNLDNISYPYFRYAISECKINMHTAVLLLDVLYGYETWSLTLREGHVCSPKRAENRVLRIMGLFGSKREQVTK
jgi:hypothetical protein